MLQGSAAAYSQVYIYGWITVSTTVSVKVAIRLWWWLECGLMVSKSIGIRLGRRLV